LFPTQTEIFGLSGEQKKTFPRVKAIFFNGWGTTTLCAYLWGFWSVRKEKKINKKKGEGIKKFF